LHLILLYLLCIILMLSIFNLFNKIIAIQIVQFLNRNLLLVLINYLIKTIYQLWVNASTIRILILMHNLMVISSRKLFLMRINKTHCKGWMPSCNRTHWQFNQRYFLCTRINQSLIINCRWQMKSTSNYKNWRNNYNWINKWTKDQT